jgi:hypothetical protein
MTWGQAALWIVVILVVSVVVVALAALVSRRPDRHPAFTGRNRPPPAQVTSGAGPATPLRVVLGPPRRLDVNLQALFGGPPLRRGPPLVLPGRQDPLWREKGWRRNGAGYAGYYHAGGDRWRGLVREPYPGGFEAYIWRPPLAELRRYTSYAACFQATGGNGSYKVHFHTMPDSVDHTIAAIEEVLGEAVGVR